MDSIVRPHHRPRPKAQLVHLQDVLQGGQIRSQPNLGISRRRNDRFFRARQATQTQGNVFGGKLSRVYGVHRDALEGAGEGSSYDLLFRRPFVRRYQNAEKVRLYALFSFDFSSNGWSTVAIIEELEDEAHLKGLLKDDHHTLKYSFCERIIDRNRVLGGKTNSEHHPENEYWGSFFREPEFILQEVEKEGKPDNQKSPERHRLSYWGHVSHTHADLYVASLEELAKHAPDAKLTMSDDPNNTDFLHIGSLLI